MKFLNNTVPTIRCAEIGMSIEIVMNCIDKSPDFAFNTDIVFCE